MVANHIYSLSYTAFLGKLHSGSPAKLLYDHDPLLHTEGKFKRKLALGRFGAGPSMIFLHAQVGL